MVKSKYEAPEVEIIAFQTEDVITASGPSTDEDIELPFVPFPSDADVLMPRE